MTPLSITNIRNVEVSSRCNLRCGYCIHPTMPRPKVDMTDAIWQRVLVWIAYFVARGTQAEVNLNGTGESTLHPKFVEMVGDVRRVLGPDGVIQFTTNGKGCTEELVKALEPFNPRVCVTAHHVNIAKPAMALYEKYGLLRSVSMDPMINSQDWAGQVNWPVRTLTPKPACKLLVERCGTINADGVFVMCCMDGKNESVIGSVFDEPTEKKPKVHDFRLCGACWQRPPNDHELNVNALAQMVRL